MKTLKDIEFKIIQSLRNIGKSEYFTVYKENGEAIKIRISDHSANKLNNDGVVTLSFVKNTTIAKSIGRYLDTEFVIKNGSPIENFKTIEELLDYYDISNDQESAEDLHYEKY